MRNDLIEDCAKRFRQANGLDQDSPINPYTLLLGLNIVTLFRNLDENFSGMCLKNGDNRFILVNSSHSLGRQHFTIGHEIYHLFFQEDFKPHACSPGTGKTPEEKDADLFSSILLMPEYGIRRMIPKHELLKRNISTGTVLKLEQYFGVSHNAMLNRLHQLKLTSDSNDRELRETTGIRRLAASLGFDTSLYGSGNQNKTIGDYGIIARRLFEEGHISEGHYYELIGKIGITETSGEDHETKDTIGL